MRQWPINFPKRSPTASPPRLRHFKIKINGQLDTDLTRLETLAEIITRHAPTDFAFTLDGNEQFKSITDLQTFWPPFRITMRFGRSLNGCCLSNNHSTAMWHLWTPYTISFRLGRIDHHYHR